MFYHHAHFTNALRISVAVLATALCLFLVWSGRVHAGSSDYEPGGRYDYSAPKPFSGSSTPQPAPYAGPSYQRPNIDQQQLEQDLKRYGTPDGKGGYRGDYRQSNEDQRQMEIDRKRYGNY